MFTVLQDINNTKQDITTKHNSRSVTLSPVISLFPAGFHVSTVTSELCWALLEKVDMGLVFPSTTQHDTMPARKTLTNVFIKRKKTSHSEKQNMPIQNQIIYTVINSEGLA